MPKNYQVALAIRQPAVDDDMDLIDDVAGLFSLSSSSSESRTVQIRLEKACDKDGKVERKVSKSKKCSKYSKKSQIKMAKENVTASPVTPPVQEIDVLRFDYELAYEKMLNRFITCRDPRFGNYDSLVDFPHGMVHCLNSGDFAGLSDLTSSLLERSCNISFSYNKAKLSCRSFVRFFELMNDVHPDRIMTVHTSQLVDNEVVATTYIKFTDCKLLYEAVARGVRDPILYSFFPGSRAACLGNKMRIEARPEHERQQLAELLESSADLVVYGCVQMRLKTDGFSRKGTEFKMLCNFNSAYPAKVIGK